MPSTPAVSDASTAALIPIGSKAASVPVIEIKRPVFLIGGRKEAVKLHLDSSTVSKLHCAIVLNAWGCYVHDLGSRTGTLVNGQPVVDQDLSDGDEIQIGRFRFKFRAPKRTTPKPTPLPAADLVVSGLDLPLTAHKRVLTIGRRAGSDVEFEEKSVSNLHALIVEQDGRRLLRDLGSRTGTWIGDHPIHQEVLPDGAGFRIGRAVLTLTSRRAALELPLDEPIPLSEAPRPATPGLSPTGPSTPGIATPGIVPTAGLGTLDLGAIDFAAVEDLDHAGPVAVPVDDDLSLIPLEEPHAAPEDDLAALRRNWQATPRPTAEIPPVMTPALPAAPAVAPAPIPPVTIPPVPPLAPAARAPIPSIPHRPAVPTLEQPSAPVLPADLPVVEHLPAPAGPPVIPDTIAAIAEAPAADEIAADEITLVEADEADIAAEVDVRDHEAEPGPVTAGLEVPAPIVANAPAPTADIDELVLDPDAPEAVDLDALDLADLAPAAEARADTEADLDALVVDPDAPAVAPEPAAEAAAPDRLAIVDDLELIDERPTAENAAAVAEELILADGGEPTSPVAETPSDEAALEDAPAAAVPTAEAPAAGPIDLELSPLDADVAADEMLVADGAAPAGPLVADEPADVAADTEIEVAAKAEAGAGATPDAKAEAAETVTAGVETADLEPVPEPLDLDAIELVLDPDAPAVAVEPTEVDALQPDPDAPAPLAAADSGLLIDDAVIDDEVAIAVDDVRVIEDAMPADTAMAAEDAAAIAETSTAGVAGLASAVVADETDSETDVAAVADAETVPVAGSDETDVPWPTAGTIDADVDAAAEANADADTDAATDAGMLDLAPAADAVDLEADADFTEAEPATVAAAIVTDDVDLSDHPTPAEAAAETVAEVAGEHPPLADDLAATLTDVPAISPDARDLGSVLLEDAGLARAIGTETDAVEDRLHGSLAPGLADDAVDAGGVTAGNAATSPVIEEPAHAPDLVRITDDFDEDADDATALAVDLGLVLDDDLGPGMTGLAELSEAPPAEPVDVDLTASRYPRPGGSVDLSRLGPQSGGPNGQPAVAPADHAADEEPHEDVFDADSVEVVKPPLSPIASPPAPPSAAPPLAPAASTPAAEAPKKQPPKNDELSGPYGGSLADLMPGGPPLLGGSFMSLPPMMPPTAPVPSIPARGRPRRVGFGGEPARPAQRGPFSAQRTIADAIEPGSTVDDDDINLAPPPAATPSADAFSAPVARPMTAAPLNFNDRAASDATLPALTPRPRGTIRPVLTGEAPATALAPVALAMPTGPTEAELIGRARLHKKRVRRVIACVLAMIVLIGGAAWGVLYFLPPTARVDALINFENLDRVSPEEQQLLRTRLNDMLASESVRQDAITLKPATVDNGFLASPKQVFDSIDRDPKVRWPSDRPTFMRLRVHSLDKENDIARVRALGQALVKTGEADRGKSGDLAAAVRNYSDQITRKNQELADLSDQIQALKQAKAGRPQQKDLSALNAEFLAAEQALTTIKSRRQELDARVELLKKPAVAAPSTGPAIDPVTADQELAALTQELNKVQQAVIKPSPVATEERKQLDAAFKELEEQLAAVQGQKANPALVAYANKVGRGFKQVRDMTEQLFRRQDGQRQRLADLKAKMSENLQALTQRRLENDAELKKLRDGVELFTRRYNAAMASGESEAAKKVQLDLQRTKIEVSEAEEKYKNQDDPVYTPAIQSLQQFIDQQETETRTDRKNVEDRLAQLQGDFMQDAPDTGNLPADQKQLVENIQKKLTAMTDARRATAAAEEKALAEQAKTEAAANESAADLRLKIASRRQDVLAAARARQAEQDETTRRQRLTDAQAELTSVRQQEQTAAHRRTDAETSIETAERQKRVDAQSETDLNAKLAARDNVERDRRSAQDALAGKQAALAKLIVPDREVEVHSADDPDRRPMVFATVAGTSVVLLLIPILLNLMALAREAQLPYAHLVAEIDPDAIDEGFDPMLDDEAAGHAKALPEPAHS